MALTAAGSLLAGPALTATPKKPAPPKAAPPAPAPARLPEGRLVPLAMDKAYASFALSLDDVTRQGDSVDYTLLVIPAAPAAPLTVLRMRMDCKARNVAFLSGALFAEDGAAKGAAAPLNAPGQIFPAIDGYLCQGKAPPAIAGSRAELLQAARAGVVRQQAAAPFAPPAGRYGDLTIDPSNPFYLALGSVTRHGDVVEAVIAVINPAGVQDRETFAYAIFRERFDCKAATEQSLGGEAYHRGGAAMTPLRAAEKPSPFPAGKGGAWMIDICAGKTPERIHETFAVVLGANGM